MCLAVCSLSDGHIEMHTSASASAACSASLPSVYCGWLYCAAGHRHGLRHGAIVMAILQYQYPDTATKRQQPMPHHSTPLTPLLSFSLHPHQSIPPSLTKYVRIDSASAPCSPLPSLSHFFFLSLKHLSGFISPQTTPYVALFSSSSSVISSPFFTPSCSPCHLFPPPLHVFFSFFLFLSPSHSLSAY